MLPKYPKDDTTISAKYRLSGCSVQYVLPGMVPTTLFYHVLSSPIFGIWSSSLVCFCLPWHFYFYRDAEPGWSLRRALAFHGNSTSRDVVTGCSFHANLGSKYSTPDAFLSFFLFLFSSSSSASAFLLPSASAFSLSSVSAFLLSICFCNYSPFIASIISLSGIILSVHISHWPSLITSLISLSYWIPEAQAFPSWMIQHMRKSFRCSSLTRSTQSFSPIQSTRQAWTPMSRFARKSPERMVPGVLYLEKLHNQSFHLLIGNGSSPSKLWLPWPFVHRSAASRKITICGLIDLKHFAQQFYKSDRTFLNHILGMTISDIL